MTRLLTNLSMLGSRVSGLHVYAEHCAAAIERASDATILASTYQPVEKRTKLVPSPVSISMGSGKYAAVRRAAYSYRWKPPSEEVVVYTPTHHGLRNAKRQIITVHDLIPIRHPRQYRTQAYYYKYILSALVKRVDAVFTVSETAKAELLDVYALDEKSVYVVPNGVDPTVFCPDRTLDEREDFLLVVGASYRHKNVEELLQVAGLWSGKYRLKIVSAPGRHSDSLKLEVARRNLSGRVDFLSSVSRANLADLYRRAAALVYPSQWEGFGIPPLEALASGCPVVVSRIAVHCEVLGDAAIYVELGRRDSWEEAFNKLESPSTVNRCLKGGEDVVRKFSWERSGATLVSAISRVYPECVFR